MPEHNEYACFDRRITCDIGEAIAHKAAEEVAHKAAEAAVKQVFAQMGIDIDVPKEMEEFRKDLRLSNQIRKAVDKGFFTILYTGIVVFIVAGFYSIASKIHGG